MTRRFDKPGIYTAHLTVTDDSGATNSTAADEVKIAVNDRPVAVAGPDIVTDRLVVAFDGTRSIDADGDPLTFRWDFGDGMTGVGAKVLHIYAEGGTYPVVLVVDDGKALSNSTSRATLQLTIHRPPGPDRASAPHRASIASVFSAASTASTIPCCTTQP